MSYALRISLFLVACSVTIQASRADDAGWWQTSEQKAESAYHEGDAAYLIDQGPSHQWQGLGYSLADDYAKAAEQFTQEAELSNQSGDASGRNLAIYNRGVNEVRLGQYQKAIESFDEVINQNPDFPFASHNRSIAQQLLERQQQLSDSADNKSSSTGDNESQQREEGGSDSKQENTAGADQDPDGQDSEGTKPDSSSDTAEAGESNNDPSTTEQEQASSSDKQQAAEAEAAQQALSAEASTQQQGQGTPGEQSMTQAQAVPLSESEQATEQLLRRIPDDPAGLLRRKLEQNHLSNFPEVRTSNDPW